MCQDKRRKILRLAICHSFETILKIPLSSLSLSSIINCQRMQPYCRDDNNVSNADFKQKDKQYMRAIFKFDS